MKFSAFSDFHHHPGVFLNGTLEDWRVIRRRAEESGAEFIIHAGDLCHGPSLVPDFIAEVNASPIPVYHCLGNHDSDRTSYAETLKAYNMPDGHYFFECGGYRFVICDPNYGYVDGEYLHYDLGNYYKWPECRDYMPPEQLDWLRETIAGAPHPCILISHESFERPDGVKNAAEVRRIINQYNPACELEVDGGIAPNTAPLVIEAGANVLVAGSSVYGASDIDAAIASLRVK